MSSSSLLETLVHIFFFSAVFVGLTVHLNPQFYQGVVIPGRPATGGPSSVSSNSHNVHITSNKHQHEEEKSLLEEITANVEKFNVNFFSLLLLLKFFFFSFI
jgi:hypothetical protein